MNGEENTTINEKKVEIQFPVNLRDYFAAAAVSAIPHIGCGADLYLEDIAKSAYDLADEMLNAREPKQTPSTEA